MVVSASVLVSLSLHASQGSTAHTCQQSVSTFLDNPNKSTLAALSGLRDSTCWDVIGSSNTDLNRLNEWAEKGNPWAAQYVANHLKRLDGGNLEDALRALGQFSEHDMEGLLILASRGGLSSGELTDALTMLPLNLGDDSAAQLKALAARRELVMGVTRKDLAQQKAEALKAIDDFASEIRAKSNR